MTYNKEEIISELITLAGSELTPAEELRAVFNLRVQLFEEKDFISYDKLGVALASNPNISKGVLLCLLEEEKNISAFCQNPVIDLLFLEDPLFLLPLFERLNGYYLERLVTSRYCTTKVMEMAVKTIYGQTAKAFVDEKIEIAARKDLTPYCYEKLASDKSFHVRNAIALNHRTPADILSRLSKDVDPDVRQTAIAQMNFNVSFLLQKRKDLDLRAELGYCLKSTQPSQKGSVLIERKKDWF
jgi:hypothetical protein